METALVLMQKMADMVNSNREIGNFKIANEHFDMLCGAMCMFNEYERANGKQAVLGELNNKVVFKIVEV